MIQAVIFDLDGVIVTTDDCHYRAWKTIADQEGIYFDRTINERLRGVSRMESLEILLERADKSYTSEQKEALATSKNEIYKQLILSLTPDDLLEGVKEVLTILKNNNIKIAVGSSSKNTPLILERIGLSTFFDAVSDGNNITHSKPHPEVFIKAADMLGIPCRNCLVFEDADAGVAAAIAANMKVFGVGFAAHNPSVAYGSPRMDHQLIEELKVCCGI